MSTVDLNNDTEPDSETDVVGVVSWREHNCGGDGERWWACYIYVLKIDKEYINYPIFISCYFLVLLKSLTLFSLCSQTTFICSPCSLQSALFNFFIGKIFYKVTSCRFGFGSFVILFFKAAQEVGIRRWLLTLYIETISVVLNDSTNQLPIRSSKQKQKWVWTKQKRLHHNQFCSPCFFAKHTQLSVGGKGTAVEDGLLDWVHSYQNRAFLFFFFMWQASSQCGGPT